VPNQRVTNATTPQFRVVDDRDRSGACTVVFLFSALDLEEPFTVAEGIYIGLQSEAPDGSSPRQHRRALYTSVSVQFRRSWRNRC
jgi:hypothetical protein